MKSDNSVTKKEYYWLIYAEHYLCLAEIGVTEIVNNVQQGGLIKKVSISHERRLGIIPVIYCIRHSLELTKKYILSLDGKQIPKGHELSDQLDSIESIIRRYISNESLSKDLAEFKYLLLKYEYGIFQHGKAFTKHEVKDPNNEIFRYPQKTNGEIIQIVDLVKEFPLKFIHDLRFDIYTIYTVLIFFQENEGWLEDIASAKKVKELREAILKDSLGKMYK